MVQLRHTRRHTRRASPFDPGRDSPGAAQRPSRPGAKPGRPSRAGSRDTNGEGTSVKSLKFAVTSGQSALSGPHRPGILATRTAVSALWRPRRRWAPLATRIFVIRDCASESEGQSSHRGSAHRKAALIQARCSIRAAARCPATSESSSPSESEGHRRRSASQNTIYIFDTIGRRPARRARRAAGQRRRRNPNCHAPP